MFYLSKFAANYPVLKTFVKYVGIQVLAYGFDFAVFLTGMHVLHLGPILSNVLSKVSAGILACNIHQRYTFRLGKDERSKAQTFKYFLVLCLNIPFSASVLWMVLQAVSTPVIAKIVSDVICVSVSFFLNKHWVFTSGPREYETTGT